MRLTDTEATLSAGALLAAGLPPMPREAAAVLYLEGSLGAGKTTLTRGLLRALGVTGSVRSPTYTLIEPYQTPAGPAVIHMDLYRLVDAEEVEMLGIRELLEPGALLAIEWPERGVGWLPPADLTVRLALDGEGRRLTLTPGSAWGEAWARTFEQRFGRGNS